MPVFHYIDNNTMLLKVFSSLMMSFDQEILTFSCPIKYLEYMNSPEYEIPTAVFMDLQMPRMHGYTLIDKITEQYPDIRFVTISGFEGTVRGGHKSACMHVRKPFRIETLREAVELLLKCRQDGAEAADEMCIALYQKVDCDSGERTCPHKETCHECS